MHNRGDISLFRKDSFPEIFKTSLRWNHYAQNIFWHLIRVDSVSLDWIFDSLCLVREKKHPTVGLNLMNMLQIIDLDITISVVRGLFARSSDDNLTINLLNVSNFCKKDLKCSTRIFLIYHIKQLIIFS
jgi:hypothetical protein